jgi:hypothetical protein
VVAVERVVAARNRSLVPATALTPLLILGLGVAVDLWVYFDARRHEAVGKPVILRAGSLTIETPAAWAAGCLILWIVLFPLYVTSRPWRHVGSGRFGGTTEQNKHYAGDRRSRGASSSA